MGAPPSTTLSFTFEEIEKTATDIVAKAKRVAANDPDFARTFGAAFRGVERVAVRHLAPSEGAMCLEQDTLVFHAPPLTEILRHAIKHLASFEAAGEYLAPDQVAQYLTKVAMTYMLHEVVHRAQGLGDYHMVGIIKQAGGPRAMAMMDTFADHSAAFGMAVLFADDRQDRGCFLRAFQEALFFTVEHYVEVFPPSHDRPDKIGRFIGVMMMAARLIVAEAQTDEGEFLTEDAAFPLDTPLMATVPDAADGFVLFRTSPEWSLVKAANDDCENEFAVKALVAGDIKAAMGACIRIARRMAC